MKNVLTIVVAVAVVLGGLEWYRVHQTGKLVAAAHVAQGLALAGSVKNHVAAFLAEQGRFPSSNDELGLPEAERFAGQALTRLAVSEGGIITVTFNKLSGVAGGTIRLLPDEDRTAVGMRWRCETPSYRDIATLAPQCSYVP